MRAVSFIVVLVGAIAAFMLYSGRGPIGQPEAPQLEDPGAPEDAAPVGDADIGRALFISEGCISCHSVRGVGGKAGPPFDVLRARRDHDPMDFAARMWMGAPVMLKLQDAWVGYQIDLTGDELRHLAAFANDPAAQDRLPDEDIPQEIRDYFLDQFYIDEDIEGRYDGEEWLEYSRRPPND